MDIAIEKESFLMFIETKIRAGETGNQLARYDRILHSRDCGKTSALVFLTPIGRAAWDEDSAEDIAYLSWSHLADELELAASGQKSLWALLVQQFCNHIRQF